MHMTQRLEGKGQTRPMDHDLTVGAEGLAKINITCAD